MFVNLILWCNARIPFLLKVQANITRLKYSKKKTIFTHINWLKIVNTIPPCSVLLSQMRNIRQVLTFIRINVQVLFPMTLM